MNRERALADQHAKASKIRTAMIAGWRSAASIRTPVAFCLFWLVLAIVGRWPYFIYVLMRVSICAASAYLVRSLVQQKFRIWPWIIGAIAILYNPIQPARMHRRDWWIVNVLTVIAFLALFFDKFRAGVKHSTGATEAGDDLESQIAALQEEIEFYEKELSEFAGEDEAQVREHALRNGLPKPEFIQGLAKVTGQTPAELENEMAEQNANLILEMREELPMKKALLQKLLQIHQSR